MATASAGALSVTIGVVDRITAPLSRITAAAERLQGHVARLSTRMRSLSQLDRVAGAARGVARSMAQIVPPLSAITAAGTLAGVVNLASRWAAFATQMGTTAYRVMTTVSSLTLLQNAGRLAGVSAETVAQGLQGLGDALSDAVGGRDSTALQYLTLLGVKLRDAAGNARTAAETLPEVADGVARIADPRLQARVLSALRLPESMLPYLKEGSAGLKRWEADAKRFGVITEEGAKIGAKFAETQERLKMAAEGLVNSIAQRLAPVIGPMLERLTEWIAANREVIAQKIGETVDKWAAAIERFVTEGGLQELVRRLGEMAEGISKAVEWMGGWEKAAIALGVVLTANLVAPLASLVASLSALAAFRVPVWMLRLLGPAALLGGGAWALSKLGDQRDNSPEKQAEQRRAMAERGRLGGFYAGPAEDPGGPEANRLTGWLSALTQKLRRQMTPGTPHTSRAPAPGRSASDPRGLRNNNPLNLGFVAGQQGLDPAAPSDGRFGRYTSMEAGIAQSVRQMQIHARRGFDTVGKLIQKWAPETENDTAGYIRRVEAETGLGRDSRIDFTDEAMLARLVRAMARVENGRAPGDDVIQRGVAQAVGRPLAATTSTQPASQKVEHTIRFSGLPAGVTATTTTRTEDGGVRVARSSPGLSP